MTDYKGLEGVADEKIRIGSLRMYFSAYEEIVPGFASLTLEQRTSEGIKIQTAMALKLPPDHHVLGVRFLGRPLFTVGRIQVFVTGPECPVKPDGYEPGRIDLEYTHGQPHARIVVLEQAQKSPEQLVIKFTREKHLEFDFAKEREKMRASLYGDVHTFTEDNPTEEAARKVSERGPLPERPGSARVVDIDDETKVIDSRDLDHKATTDKDTSMDAKTTPISKHVIPRARVSGNVDVYDEVYSTIRRGRRYTTEALPDWDAIGKIFNIDRADGTCEIALYEGFEHLGVKQAPDPSARFGVKGSNIIGSPPELGQPLRDPVAYWKPARFGSLECGRMVQNIKTKRFTILGFPLIDRDRFAPANGSYYTPEAVLRMGRKLRQQWVQDRYKIPVTDGRGNRLGHFAIDDNDRDTISGRIEGISPETFRRMQDGRYTHVVVETMQRDAGADAELIGCHLREF